MVPTWCAGKFGMHHMRSPRDGAAVLSEREAFRPRVSTLAYSTVASAYRRGWRAGVRTHVGAPVRNHAPATKLCPSRAKN